MLSDAATMDTHHRVFTRLNISLLLVNYSLLKVTMSRAIVCAIALKEELYIDEWIAHNLKIGFDSVVIYDNSDDHSLVDLPDKYLGRVTVIHYPGKVRQVPAYNDALARFRADTWCAFIDVDEFIVLRKHPDIKTLLADVAPQGGALALNWIMFGSSGREEYSPEPVTKRFTWRAREVNAHVKTIAYLPHVTAVPSPHYCNVTHTVDCHGNAVDGPFNQKKSEDVACIYHYFTKSRGEFLRKRERGRADIAEIRGLSEFADNDINEVEDLTLA